MTRDEFVEAVVHNGIVNADTSRFPSPTYRQYFGDLFRRYLADLGCAPDMTDWAADKAYEWSIAEELVISERSAGAVADELERMVRA